MSQMKTLTINGTKYDIVPVVPATSVTLLANAWVGDGDRYSQVVEVPGVTDHTKVDLQPTSAQLEEFHYKVLAFVAENDGGVVTVYSIGDKPENDHTIQVTKTEVEGVGKIRGNTVGTSMPRPDWNQNDPKMADYIKNKPDLEAQLASKAPAGFGLGETPPIITDANQATKSGFYRFNGVSCANLPSNWQCVYGTLIVSEGLSFIEQILVAQDVLMRRTKDEGQSDWGDWVDYSASAFAPSGYGLGNLIGESGVEVMTTTAEVDNFRQNGWRAYWNPGLPLFSMNTGLSGSLLCYGLIRVDSGAWSQRQTYIPRTYPQYALQRYAEDGGAWGEWEWINPPMVSGVEYRTTERYDNQTVYVKRTGSVQLPGNSTRSISYCGDANVKATPVSVQPLYAASCAAEYSAIAGIPPFVEKVWADANEYEYGNSVSFTSNSYTDTGYDADSATVSAIVKYIKEVVS